MKRTLEPELMDEGEQARAYAAADFSEPHDRFVALFARTFPGLVVDGTVLDLGCGPADVTMRFARAWPAATVHGVDGAEAMLAEGRRRIALESAALQARIALHRAYLPDEKPPLARYDVVISNSLLHHLPEASTLWRSVRAFAAAGAPVFVMDLMRPETLADVERIVRASSGDEPEVLQRDFHASLCAAFTVEEVRAQLAAAELTDLRIDVISDRHFVVSGRAPGTRRG